MDHHSTRSTQIGAKTCFMLAACVVAFSVCAFVISSMRGASHMAWTAGTKFYTESLARYVELFNEEEGHYPTTLADLTNNISFKDNSNLNGILRNRENRQYAYCLKANGFLITVTGHSGLFQHP